MDLIKKDSSPVVLVKAGSDEDQFCTTRFAVVTFTEELIERISKLRKARELAETYEISEFNYACDFVNEHDFATEREEETINEDEIVELERFTEDNAGAWAIEPLNEDLAGFRTSGDMMYVSEYGVKFDAYLKHTNDRIYTERIPFDMIDSIKF